VARIAVVSFPILDKQTLDWIEAIRAEHDPQAGRIQPHFTLVFPVDEPPADVAADITRATVRHAPVAFVIRKTIALPDVVHGGGHVFLVPDEGRDQINRLHDDLYSGVLRPHLREDIAFIPHVTIAADGDVRWCEAYAEQLNKTLQPVQGVIEGVTLVDVTATGITSLASFGLGTAPSPPT